MDSVRSIYITGGVSIFTAPLLPVTPQAVQPNPGRGADAFVAKLVEEPPSDHGGDRDVDVDDIRAGFPDSNGNGVFDIFDPRACRLQCSVPGCWEP